MLLVAHSNVAIEAAHSLLFLLRQDQSVVSLCSSSVSSDLSSSSVVCLDCGQKLLGQPSSSTETIRQTLGKYPRVASVSTKSPLRHFTRRAPASEVLPNPAVCCGIQEIHTAHRRNGSAQGASRIHQGDAHVPSSVDVAILTACPFCRKSQIFSCLGDGDWDCYFCFGHT